MALRKISKENRLRALDADFASSVVFLSTLRILPAAEEEDGVLQDSDDDGPTHDAWGVFELVLELE